LDATTGVLVMRVTIVTRPRGAIRGMWLASLQVGQTYNLQKAIAQELILEGYAIEEHRMGERRKPPRPDSRDRRRGH
jgi:hypothetical protein